MKRRDAKLRPALLERLRNGGTADRQSSGQRRRPTAGGREHDRTMPRPEGRRLPGNWAVAAQEVGRGVLYRARADRIITKLVNIPRLVAYQVASRGRRSSRFQGHPRPRVPIAAAMQAR